MIGTARVEPRAFWFKIMTGKQLRQALKGLHDNDTVLALVQKVDDKIQFKQEGNTATEVVTIGIERERV